MIGQKHDKQKPRMSLLPQGALNAVIRVLEFGATKYQEDNWKHVHDAKTRYYDAMQRHIDAWWNGEQKDPETGEHHLAHATCCAMFLMWFDFNGYRNAPVTPQAILDAESGKRSTASEKCDAAQMVSCEYDCKCHKHRQLVSFNAKTGKCHSCGGVAIGWEQKK